MLQTCKQCSLQFDIPEQDLQFYEKVSPVFPSTSSGQSKGKKYLLPPPTLCPDCREQRRLCFRNERNLYIRKCQLCRKDIVSVFSPDKNYNICCPECWYSDQWDAVDVGRDFDFNRGFFEQINELIHASKLLSLFIRNNQNSDYVNHETDDKNCYLNFGGHYNEDCYYNTYSLHGKNNVDNYWIMHSELLYQCLDCEKCYHSTYLQDCISCTDCHYCTSCTGCHDCFGSINLQHKEYYFFNQPFSKEEYNKKVTAYLQGHTARKKAFKESQNHFLQYPHRAAKIISSENSLGDRLFNCKNVQYGFTTENAEDCKYIYIAVDLKDCYDITSVGWGELAYNSASSIELNNVLFSSAIIHLDFSSYCFYCTNSSHLFGCVGLNRKQYCILNKQYTKEEYEELVPKIIEHMMKIPLSTPLPPLTGGQEKDFNSGEQKSLPASFLKREEYVSSLKKGIYPSPPVKGDLGGYEWGEFFPAHLSPFGYNETVANEYYPLTREQVLETSNQGNSVETPRRGVSTIQHGQIFNWSDYEPPKPDVKKIIPAEKLPDDIKKIPDDILNWAIECEVTKKPFRIIKQELEFYRQHNLPIPRRHPDQRHKDRLQLRNPRKLWKRNCMKCSKEIQTTYSPDRPEIVYCEECYLKEVY